MQLHMGQDLPIHLASTIMRIANGWNKMVIVAKKTSIRNLVDTMEGTSREFRERKRYSGAGLRTCSRPYFEATGNPLQFHYQKEGHWNKDAHRMAAQEIFDYLTVRKGP